MEIRFDGEIHENWDNGFHYIQHTNYNSVMAVPSDMYVQVLEGRIAGQVVLDDIADGCGRQEKWNVDIFKMTLPRIYKIVVEMDRREIGRAHV